MSTNDTNQTTDQFGSGYFDDNGNACLNFQLRGTRHDHPVEYQGIIDTGFTGFIHLPISEAIALSLPLAGSTTTTLADDSTIVQLTCFIEATIDQSNTEQGIAIISMTSNEILLGMEFLRQFNKAIVVSNELGVVLIDEGLLRLSVDMSE